MESKKEKLRDEEKAECNQHVGMQTDKGEKERLWCWRGVQKQRFFRKNG